ncbi:MAG: aminoacyl-tRNA hydrolase [Victivallales bacterium]|nr:aminoacyl-tRNA hydrolase [Victivallales bacterium]MCF7889096.1 aminoacyl-tRNA hydrolase [Victivallales bacterium]
MSDFKKNNELCAVVGLGNPGIKFQNTKHNIGFKIIDSFLSCFSGKAKQVSGCHGECISKQVFGKKVYFLKPLTFMNLSGFSVSALCRKKNINPAQVLIVYDDMDLPFGKIRIRKSGGSAGHNGINSIINELGTKNFPRLRVGIGKVSINETVSHVLTDFTIEDKKILPTLLELSHKAIRISLRRGINTAMNELNGHSIITAENKLPSD